MVPQVGKGGVGPCHRSSASTTVFLGSPDSGTEGPFSLLGVVEARGIRMAGKMGCKAEGTRCKVLSVKGKTLADFLMKTVLSDPPILPKGKPQKSSISPNFKPLLC